MNRCNDKNIVFPSRRILACCCAKGTKSAEFVESRQMEMSYYWTRLQQRFPLVFDFVFQSHPASRQVASFLQVGPFPERVVWNLRPQPTSATLRQGEYDSENLDGHDSDSLLDGDASLALPSQRSSRGRVTSAGLSSISSEDERSVDGLSSSSRRKRPPSKPKRAKSAFQQQRPILSIMKTTMATRESEEEL